MPMVCACAYAFYACVTCVGEVWNRVRNFLKSPRKILVTGVTWRTGSKTSPTKAGLHAYTSITFTMVVCVQGNQRNI